MDKKQIEKIIFDKVNIAIQEGKVKYVPDKRIVIFCDGDFWHGYNFLVKKKRLKRGYWEKKIKKNIDRDKKVNYKLKSEGWTILRFWEHDINKNIRKCEKKILKAVSKL